MRERAMSACEVIQLGVSILVLGIFLGYAFVVLRYALGKRSVIDDRLRRYGRITERSGFTK